MITSATVDVCEDIRFEHDGKFTLVGVFTNDIALIPDIPARRIIFLFHIDGSMDAIPDSLAVEVTLPLVKPSRQNIDIPEILRAEMTGNPSRTRWTVRGVVVFVDQIFGPGQIVAKVIADGSEYYVGAPSLVAVDPVATSVSV
jgi:hypothetical protein